MSQGKFQSGFKCTILGIKDENDMSRSLFYRHGGRKKNKNNNNNQKKYSKVFPLEVGKTLIIIIIKRTFVQ